jgi:hypothetical protein
MASSQEAMILSKSMKTRFSISAGWLSFCLLTRFMENSVRPAERIIQLIYYAAPLNCGAWASPRGPQAAPREKRRIKTKPRNQCRNLTFTKVGSDPDSREFFSATPQERASAGGRELICPTL